MRRVMILAAALMLLTGCGKPAEEPVRQLFFPAYTVLKTDVTVPAWFYPDTGDVEFLCAGCVHQCMYSEYTCSEEMHGEECLFYKFNPGMGYSLVEGKLYYFLAEDLYVYDTATGEREQLKDTATSGWGDESYIFNGEYLYHYDRDSERENGKGYTRIERIHLPDMGTEDINGQGLVWKIKEGVGYYVMADSSPYIISGLYSQPLYTAEEEPPAKELLLHEVELGIYTLLTEDAVYWIGNDRLEADPDVVTHNLYRYDLKKQSIILVAEDFGVGRIVSDGEYLYAVRQQEDGYALIRTDDYGNITVLGMADDDQRLLPASADIVGQYVIADVVSDKADGMIKSGKMVYDMESGEIQTYWLQE